MLNFKTESAFVFFYRYTVIFAVVSCTACSGLGQQIERPNKFDRYYYSPEKEFSQSTDNIPEIVQQKDVNFYREHQPFERYKTDMFNAKYNVNACKQSELNFNAPKSNPYLYSAPPLSPGDRVQILVHEGKEFSGIYEINLDGTIGLPMVEPVFVSGSTPAEAQQLIFQSLIKNDLFRKDFLRVSVRVQQWAAVQVQVQGAVFHPGMVTINSRTAEDRSQQSTQWSGDFPTNRLLNSALLAAGGIRPDANIQKTYLIRDEKQTLIDLSGLLDGSPLQLPALASGDRIYIPSTHFFDGKLVRPTSITPAGIRIFISNLTTPSSSNANSAIGKHATSLPYGTRLLTAAISANCVGGSSFSNSSRTTVLVSTNPITGKTEIIERSLEKLLTNRNRDAFNPHIMPGDGIVCYDSNVTNLREIGRTLTDILLPLSLF